MKEILDELTKKINRISENTNYEEINPVEENIHLKDLYHFLEYNKIKIKEDEIMKNDLLYCEYNNWDFIIKIKKENNVIYYNLVKIKEKKYREYENVFLDISKNENKEYLKKFIQHNNLKEFIEKDFQVTLNFPKMLNENKIYFENSIIKYDFKELSIIIKLKGNIKLYIKNLILNEKNYYKYKNIIYLTKDNKDYLIKSNFKENDIKQICKIIITYNKYFNNNIGYLQNSYFYNNKKLIEGIQIIYNSINNNKMKIKLFSSEITGLTIGNWIDFKLQLFNFKKDNIIKNSIYISYNPEKNNLCELKINTQIVNNSIIIFENKYIGYNDFVNIYTSLGEFIKKIYNNDLSLNEYIENLNK